MISMDFLSKLPNARVTGTEFIDFQNADFYNAMCSVLKEHIRVIDGQSRLEDSAEEAMKKLIETYIGFNNITIKWLDTGNMYVDTGYFSPGHVLNNQGVDHLLKATQTTLYRWYSENKSKVFKGGVDYTTGKVFGSFCSIPIELGINRNLDAYFPPDKVAKWGVPVEGMATGAITHEMGHAWSGCMMLMTVLEDNLVAQTALQFYRGAKRHEDRVVVLKDAATLLGMKPAKQDELLEFSRNEGDEAFMLYFTKMTVQRNNQRALSVGVTQMTSEVVADMYAIRMGCDKGIVAAIGVLTDRGIIVPIMENFLFSCSASIMFMYLTMIPVTLGGAAMAIIPIVGGVTFALSFVLGYFARGYSDIYNADHRRMEDAIRQLIAKLKDSKKMPANDKNQLVTEITKLLDINKKMRPWYEGSAVGRAFGWVFSGADFKLKEIEHYTQALNNNEISVFSEQLKGI